MLFLRVFRKKRVAVRWRAMMLYRVLCSKSLRSVIRCVLRNDLRSVIHCDLRSDHAEKRFQSGVPMMNEKKRDERTKDVETKGGDPMKTMTTTSAFPTTHVRRRQRSEHQRQSAVRI
jgi:hypothetical protein